MILIRPYPGVDCLPAEPPASGPLIALRAVGNRWGVISAAWEVTPLSLAVLNAPGARDGAVLEDSDGRTISWSVPVGIGTGWNTPREWRFARASSEPRRWIGGRGGV